MKHVLSMILPVAAASLALAATPAQAQTSNVNAMISECHSGNSTSCLKAADYYDDVEDPENPVRTLEYSKMACDRGVVLGCQLYGLYSFRTGVVIQQRIVTTLLEGDPKGEWTLKSEVNAAVDRAREYYREAQRVKPDVTDDWPAKYAELDILVQ